MGKVYIASPFFNDTELYYVELVEKILLKHGFTIFSPRNMPLDGLEIGSRLWSLEIFRTNVKFINWADFLVGVYFGNYSDSGASWEIGYSYGIAKPVLIVHIGNDSNLMVHESAHANLTLDEFKNFDFSTFPASTYNGKMY